MALHTLRIIFSPRFHRIVCRRLAPARDVACTLASALVVATVFLLLPSPLIFAQVGADARFFEIDGEKMFQRCWAAILSGCTRVRATFNPIE
jgi:hypothetical protein